MGEIDCHKDCDKCSCSVMKYDTTKCICTTYMNTLIHTLVLHATTFITN